MKGLSECSASPNPNSNVCGVIVAVRAVGGSGGLVDGMSAEGIMDLVVRNGWMRRWHVHGRDHGSDCVEWVDAQMACPRKGSWLWS